MSAYRPTERGIKIVSGISEFGMGIIFVSLIRLHPHEVVLPTFSLIAATVVSLLQSHNTRHVCLCLTIPSSAITVSLPNREPIIIGEYLDIPEPLALQYLVTFYQFLDTVVQGKVRFPSSCENSRVIANIIPLVLVFSDLRLREVEVRHVLLDPLAELPFGQVVVFKAHVVLPALHLVIMLDGP